MDLSMLTMDAETGEHSGLRGKILKITKYLKRAKNILRKLTPIATLTLTECEFHIKKRTDLLCKHALLEYDCKNGVVAQADGTLSIGTGIN